MTLKNTLKIVIYYIRSNLGHSQRLAALVKALHKTYGAKTKIVVLQSGVGADIFQFQKYCDFHVLPYSTEVKQQHKNRFMSQKKIQKRIKFISKIILKIKPDYFITEFFPFGKDVWSGEVPVVLKLAKEQNCTIIASLASLMWPENSLLILKKFYDYIFFHFPKECLNKYLTSSFASIQGKKEMRQIIKELKHKIHFTGYILDLNFWKNKIKKDHKFKKTILVSRGGGRGAKKKIIVDSMLAAKQFPRYDFWIITGPDTPSDKFAMYKKIAQRISNVTLLKQDKDFKNNLKNCSLSISMAGYNTIAELLWLKKKSVVIPYQIEEQLVRSDYINKKYNIPIIYDKNLSIISLIRAVRKAISSKRTIVRNFRDFQGISKTIKLLKKIHDKYH